VIRAELTLAGHLHKGRLYVADTLNARVVRVEVGYELEKTAAVTKE
jgi:hypothetical protein